MNKDELKTELFNYLRWRHENYLPQISGEYAMRRDKALYYRTFSERDVIDAYLSTLPEEEVIDINTEYPGEDCGMSWEEWKLQETVIKIMKSNNILTGIKHLKELLFEFQIRGEETLSCCPKCQQPTIWVHNTITQENYCVRCGCPRPIEQPKSAKTEKGKVLPVCTLWSDERAGFDCVHPTLPCNDCEHFKPKPSRP